jgi:Arc/MetJ-type ribon-helix-helix transcriptional regulator
MSALKISISLGDHHQSVLEDLLQRYPGRNRSEIIQELITKEGFRISSGATKEAKLDQILQTVERIENKLN